MKNNRMNYLLGGVLFLSLGVEQAYAIPSFARQTGFDCTVCHTVFPELTQTGREFKLRGYTMNNGEKSKMPLPLAAMVMADITKTSNTTGLASNSPTVMKDKKLLLPQVSVFYGGKITDKSGAFIQITYDGSELLSKTDIAHHTAMDNLDVRYADSISLADKELLYGLTINNNPSMADLWNTTPTWGFPYAGSVIANAPAAATQVDGGLGQSVGGIGAYAQWNDLIYAEVAAYRSARKGSMKLFGWKNANLKGDTQDVQGTTPYARLALQHNFGDNYLMLGGYIMNSKINPAFESNMGGPLDTYKDRAIDAEYQYTNGSNMITALATRIWETQTLDGSVGLLTADNLRDTLTTTRAKISYYLDQKYGATIGSFATTGTADATKYATPVGLTPNSRGEIAELDYLPLQNIKFALQYTRYDKFNGASKNYDGAGRNASDNNNLYLLGWFMF
ncbi:MAG: hypothetical protein PHO27_03955 [Sulfuricurvum sp.]|nr:hypothetical protein [Sulfuricurvum sp.]